MNQSFSIPLQAAAQEFAVSLGGESFSVRLQWRSSASGSGWYLDFVPAADPGRGVRGIPLVLGTDLLGQFQHKGIGHLVARSTNEGADVLRYEDMGTALLLLWQG